jgi:sulfur dioxygenase
MKVQIRQLYDKESSTYTYLLFDETKEAIIIDPVKEQVERDFNLVEELALKLKYILDTHVHADHVTGSYDLREKTGAKIVVGEANNLDCADVLVKDNDTLEFGNTKVAVLSTPGHTNGCTSYVVDNMVFTGDTMLIRSCGRVDFQEGSADKLYESLTKLFELNDDTKVYPAHDYKGRTMSTIGEEKKFNEFIGNNVSKDEFVNKMNDLKLPMPKHIKISVPSNRLCGEKVVEA